VVKKVTAPFAGERIRSARILYGFSQEELAKAVGVSQTLLSKVESGRRAAGQDLILGVSKATGLPASFFHVTPPELPLDSLRFRKNVTAPATETHRAEELFKEAFRIISSLLAEAKYPTPDLPLATGDVDAEMIEKLADQTREALQVGPDGPVPHVTRILERAGIAVTPLMLPSFGEDDDQPPVGHFGMSYWPGPFAHGLVGYFAGTGDRERFTLAHELGHIVLHSRRRVVPDSEAEAHHFAGAFLVPNGRMREAFRSGDLDLDDYEQMKATWGVSIQALIMRAAFLGVISSDRKTSLFKQLTWRGWRKREPVKVHNEEPLLIWKIFKLKHGGYAQAEDKLALPPVVLRSLIPMPSKNKTNRRRP
jgi:Zn-dependent peptidase ImmA (M78 family)/DNA-binding XRE family transcriptional regulator